MQVFMKMGVPQQIIFFKRKLNEGGTATVKVDRTTQSRVYNLEESHEVGELES